MVNKPEIWLFARLGGLSSTMEPMDSSDKIQKAKNFPSEAKLCLAYWILRLKPPPGSQSRIIYFKGRNCYFLNFRSFRTFS